MYQSRFHATNGIVSIALDAHSGELLELVREATGDNLIKSNCAPKAWMPFMAQASIKGQSIKGHPAQYAQIAENPQYAPTISIDQREKSALISIKYPCIVFENEIWPISVDVEIELPEGDCRSVWRARVRMDGEHELEKLYFPMLNGLWLGDTWEDDTLVLPRHAGEKIDNPVKQLAAEPSIIHWKWQEYRYAYTVSGSAAPADERESHVTELPYSGPASMLWLDLYDKNEGGGLYLTCRNDGFRLLSLRAEAFGEKQPGLGVSIGHNVFKTEGEWESAPCVVAPHEGDWHWAADEYRAWRESVPNVLTRRHRPLWFEISPGLVAHYDFKYQMHGVVHKFKDIPDLLTQARSMGLNHLLISGWNFGGFDHGFPQYRPDPELGSEQDLRDAVNKVREMGGHLAFYVNSRLCNTKYPERAKLIEDCAIRSRDGSLRIENYGAADLKFACLCNQATRWRDELSGVVNYLTRDIGADSMYLDQMAMGTGELCFHSGHTEHEGKPDMWNNGYTKMLRQMRDRYDDDGMAMLYEGCSDIHGWGVSGQLISTMFVPNAFPEMYKYVFPDQILVDMMNPRRNSGMRAEHVARKSTYLLHRAFVCGSYLWVYDLEYDNTFRRDEAQLERLRKIVALRRAWLEAYGIGRFTDTVGIDDVSEGVIAKRYEIQGGILIACSNERLRANPRVVATIPAKRVSVFARIYSQPCVEKLVTSSTVGTDARLEICLPEGEELSVIIIRNEE